MGSRVALDALDAHCNCSVTFWELEMFLLGVGDTVCRGGAPCLSATLAFFYVNQTVTCGMWPHAGGESIDQAG